MSVFRDILEILQDGDTHLETYGRRGDRLSDIKGDEVVRATRYYRRKFAAWRRELDQGQGTPGAARVVGLFFKPEETVEFLVATFAAISERFTVVPFYPNWDAATQLRYLMLYRVRHIAVGSGFFDRVSKWDQHFDEVMEVTLDEVEKSDTGDLPEAFPESLPDEHPCAWIFTSGTSGKFPKCTVISQRNMDAAVENIRKLDFLHAGMSLHSPLSTSHIFAFVVVLGILAVRPRRILFSDVQYLARLPQERIGKIDALILVPIVLNRLRTAFYERLVRGTNPSGEADNALDRLPVGFRRFVKQCVQWAEEAVMDLDQRRARGVFKTPALFVSRLLFGRAVPRRLGSPSLVVVGGAKPNVHAMAFLDVLGIRCLQGWGMTETTGPLAVCGLRDRFRGAYGTCGALFGRTGAKLDNGELIVEGDQIAEGYVDPDGTLRPFHGVKRTGDSAEFDGRGRLKILGKMNDRITLANGLNYNPIPLEETIAAKDLRLRNILDQVVVIGDGQPRLGCVFLLREPEANSQELQEYLTDVLREVQQDQPVDERIGPWVVHTTTLKDSGFLGPSGKLRRPMVEERYRILYEPDAESRRARGEKVPS